MKISYLLRIVPGILYLLFLYFYPIISDVSLGDTKDSIKTVLSPWLTKSISPKWWVLMLLLLLSLLGELIRVMVENRSLHEQVETMTSENQRLSHRIDKLSDDHITTKAPILTISKGGKRDKLDWIHECMEEFVSNHRSLVGIQLYRYSFLANRISVQRVIEYVDNVSSWRDQNFPIDPSLFKEFQKAFSEKREAEFLKKYRESIHASSKDYLNEGHATKYAIFNVLNQILKNRGYQSKERIDGLYEARIVTMFKRIGILEGILFSEATDGSAAYIFKKKYGDSSKNGRHYVAVPYLIDQKKHIMLFTFDKDLSSVEIKQNIEVIVPSFYDRVAQLTKIV